jgi:hypothetical protein
LTFIIRVIALRRAQESSNQTPFTVLAHSLLFWVENYLLFRHSFMSQLLITGVNYVSTALLVSGMK